MNKPLTRGIIYKCPKKIVRTMKLTFLLIVLGAFQTFASSFSQTTEITLDLKNAPMAQVFHEIEQQSDVRFL